MKIRNGFVSNSSSSSFIIIGDKLDTQSFLENPEKFKKEGTKIYCIGHYFCEGADVFEVIDEIIEDIKNNQWKIEYLDEIRFYRTSEEIETNNNEEKIITPDVFNGNETGNLTITSGEMDYHSTQTSEDFINNYIFRNNGY